MLDIIKINKEDKLFPEKLRKINNSPSSIYACGNLNLLKEESFSVVGTRGITDYGKKYCKKICKEIALRNIPIVSGMAIGTDTVAHKTALKYSGKTIAVLPCGFNNIFPTENKKLFKEIIKSGGLAISEYEEYTQADSGKFLERNRIVVALRRRTFCGRSTF